MEKKRERFILLSVLVAILVLFGSQIIRADLSASTAVIAVGDSYGWDNMTKGGSVETVTVTLVHDGIGGNISHFNITWSAGNYSFLYFVNSTGDDPDNINNFVAGNESLDFVNLTNVTWDSTGVTMLDWRCMNLTATSISCFNQKDPLKVGLNTTLKMFFNVSATTGHESTFNVDIETLDDEPTGGLNVSNKTFYIDGLVPRILNFNMTDGNHTVINTTWDAGDSVLDYAPLTVAVEITDLFVDTSQIWMYYQTNDSANASYSGGIYKGITRLTQTANTNKFTGIIAASDLVDQNVTSVEFYINDTVGNYDILNNTIQNEKPDAFTVLINSSHKNVLRIGNVNITDGTNTIAFDGGAGSTQYIKPDAAVIIEAEISGEAKNSSAWLYITNNSATSGPSYYEQMLDMNVTGTFPESNNERVYRYNFTAGQLNFTDTQVVTFMIVAMTNGTNANEPNYTSEFTASVTVDGTAPVPAITAPSDTSIDVSGSITYTCAAADATSSIVSHSWKLVKPDATEVTKASTLTGGKETVTWSSSETNQAGSYGVYCYAKDSVINEGVSTISQFTTTYATSGGGGSGSSGGGSSGTTTFDADLTVSEAATLTSAQGSSRTFTFDGSTSHSIKVDKVEGTLVTFTISSTPVTVTMKVGDVKEVDLNGDGLNDIEVNVESIASSVVKYSIKKIEEGATALVEEEEATAEPVTEEVEPVTEEIAGESTSTLWLWIVLVVIIIAAIVYFVIKSKR